MPGRGNAGHGAGNGPGMGSGNGPEPGHGNGGEHGRSDWSPGHQTQAAGAQSARDFAPGHRGDAAGETERDAGDAAIEQPQPDSTEREL